MKLNIGTLKKATVGGEKAPFGALSCITLTTLFVIDGATVVTLRLYGFNDPSALLLLTLAAHLATAILLTRLLMLLFPIKEGVFSVHSREADRWVAQTVLALFSCYYFDHFIPFFLKSLWYRLFGARLAPDVTISGTIGDCSLISMDAGAKLGADGLILGHWIARGRICIGRVHIGQNALIGVRAVVFPGAVVEKNAVIEAMTLVPTNQIVPSGVTWSGKAEPVSTSTDTPLANSAGHNAFEFAPPTPSSASSNRASSLLETDLRRYIHTEMSAVAPGLVGDDLDDAVLLDSVARIQLLLYVEEQYGIRISDQEAGPENFASVAALARFIVEKQRHSVLEPTPVG